MSARTASRPKSGDYGRFPLAFTLAPHLQPINYGGCFSPFGGIWSALAIPRQGWRNVRL